MSEKTTTTSRYEELLEKRLKELVNTQEAIQFLSYWVIFHRRHAAKFMELWERELRLATRERKLPFLYLANDILQNSRRKGVHFLQLFPTILQPALVHMIQNTDQRTQESIIRVLSIWEQRAVFSSNYVRDLVALCRKAQDPSFVYSPPISNPTETTSTSSTSSSSSSSSSSSPSSSTSPSSTSSSSSSSTESKTNSSSLSSRTEEQGEKHRVVDDDEDQDQVDKESGDNKTQDDEEHRETTSSTSTISPTSSSSSISPTSSSSSSLPSTITIGTTSEESLTVTQLTSLLEQAIAEREQAQQKVEMISIAALEAEVALARTSGAEGTTARLAAQLQHHLEVAARFQSSLDAEKQLRLRICAALRLSLSKQEDSLLLIRQHHQSVHDKIAFLRTHHSLLDQK